MADYFPEQHIPGIGTLAHELTAGTYWRDVRMEYSDGNIAYKGTHRQNNAGTDETTWVITKYTWSGSDIVRIQGPLLGSWDNRASLGWS